MNEYRAWARQYLPLDVDLNDLNAVYGYAAGATLVQVLTACGNDLSRASIMKQAASLKHATTPVLLKGIEINTSATDYRPIRQLKLRRFNGTRFELFGSVLSDD